MAGHLVSEGRASRLAQGGRGTPWRYRCILWGQRRDRGKRLGAGGLHIPAGEGEGSKTVDKGVTF